MTRLHINKIVVGLKVGNLRKGGFIGIWVSPWIKVFLGIARGEVFLLLFFLFILFLITEVWVLWGISHSLKLESKPLEGSKAVTLELELAWDASTAPSSAFNWSSFESSSSSSSSLPSHGWTSLVCGRKTWGGRGKMGKERGGGMGFGMVGGALLVLKESKSLLRELEPVNDGLDISLTIRDSSV